MRCYPSEWLKLPCEYCGEPFDQHTLDMQRRASSTRMCGYTHSGFRPRLPSGIDCECVNWAFDDDVAAIWPEGPAPKPGGHHPSCEHYDPPPTLALTIKKLERRLERLRNYLPEQPQSDAPTIWDRLNKQ